MRVFGAPSSFSTMWVLGWPVRSDRAARLAVERGLAEPDWSIDNKVDALLMDLIRYSDIDGINVVQGGQHGRRGSVGGGSTARSSAYTCRSTCQETVGFQVWTMVVRV